MVKKHNGRGYLPPTYRSYVFRDADPVIDTLRTLIQDHFGELNNHSLMEIKNNGGPTVTCMRGWFFGATRRPQSATIEAAGRAFGYERVWRRKQTKAK